MANIRGCAEIDLVAEALDDPERLLIADAKVSCTASEVPRLLYELESKARRCAFCEGKTLALRLWVLRPRGRAGDLAVIDAKQVLEAWRAAT